jgi:hypothetical protein
MADDNRRRAEVRPRISRSAI